MPTDMMRLLPLVVWISLIPLVAVEAESRKADVLIYGATPAGISAALAAADGNRDVLLIEPTSRIGGMITHGLSHSDFHTFESLNGPFLKALGKPIVRGEGAVDLFLF